MLNYKYLNESFFDDVQDEELVKTESEDNLESVNYTHTIGINISGYSSSETSKLQMYIGRLFALYDIPAGDLDTDDFSKYCIEFKIKYEIATPADVDFIRNVLSRAVRIADERGKEYFSFYIINLDNSKKAGFNICPLVSRYANEECHNDDAYIDGICRLLEMPKYEVMNKLNTLYVFSSGEAVWKQFVEYKAKWFIIESGQYLYYTKNEFLSIVQEYDDMESCDIYIQHMGYVLKLDTTIDDLFAGKYRKEDEYGLIKKFNRQKKIRLYNSSEAFSVANNGILKLSNSNECKRFSVFCLCNVWLPKTYSALLILMISFDENYDNASALVSELVEDKHNKK